jgi:single-strand DNA-binding protein
MYALKNKVRLIGHVGNQPEVRTIESGKKLARFSVAANEVYRKAKKLLKRNGIILLPGVRLLKLPKNLLAEAAKLLLKVNLLIAVTQIKMAIKNTPQEYR